METLIFLKNNIASLESQRAMVSSVSNSPSSPQTANQQKRDASVFNFETHITGGRNDKTKVEPAQGEPANRAPAPGVAAGKPAGMTSWQKKAEYDPDGPNNVRHNGEPCQTIAECDKAFGQKYGQPRELLRPNEHEFNWRTNYFKALSPENLADRASARSHVTSGGQLNVLVQDNQVNGSGRRQNGHIHDLVELTAQNKDYKFVNNGSITDAIAHERAMYGKPLHHVSIMTHGSPATLHEANGSGTPLKEMMKVIGPAMAKGGVLDFGSCNVAQTKAAREELQELANQYGVTIRANGNLGAWGTGITAQEHEYIFTPSKTGTTTRRNELLE